MRAFVGAIPPAVPPLVAAGVAYLAAQGFGRFGFGLVLPAMRDALGLSTGKRGAYAPPAAKPFTGLLSGFSMLETTG